jgi:hypothetical protein
MGLHGLSRDGFTFIFIRSFFVDLWTLKYILQRFSGAE